MTSNVILIICSILILGLAFFFAHFRWYRIDIVDVYVLMVAIFFGGYTLVDAQIKDLSSVKPVLGAWTLMLVVLTIGVTWVMVRFLPIGLQRALQLRYLGARWASVDGRTVLLILFLVFVFQFYSYLRFGVFVSHDLTHVSPETLESLSIMTLPYWFTSLATFVGSLSTALFVIVASKIILSVGRTRVLWIVVLPAVILLAALYGRRSIFMLMFLSFILWSILKGINPFTVRNVPKLLIGSLLVIIALLVFSNLYLIYRSDLLGYVDAAKANSIEGAAVSVEATVSNLRERMAVWQFNYTILDEQVNAMDAPPMGDIWWQGVQDNVPSAFWPGKISYPPDYVIADWYGLPIRDYPNNMFAGAQADFGYLSLVFVPLIMLLLFASMAILIRASKRHPALLWLLSSMFIYYLLQVENEYAYDFIHLYRDIIFVTVVYLTLYLLLSVPRSIVMQRRKRHGFTRLE